jgi:hypothetical protein
MRVKVLQTFIMGNSKCLENQEIEVEDWRGNRLIGEGLAVALTAKIVPPVEPAKKLTPRKYTRRKK